MNFELEKKLFEKFPDLYENWNQGDRTQDGKFGFDCEDGWFDLIMELSKEIDAYNKAHPELSATAIQVKTKYGELRFYVYGGGASVELMTKNAAARSRKICEHCGTRSNVRTNKRGLIVTLCRKCRTQINSI